MSRPLLRAVPESPERTDGYANTTTGNVPHVTRVEFLREWDYKGGHLTMIGPTQRGKTRLCLELLSRSISPQRRCLILAGKPPSRDHEMTEAAAKLNLRVIESWPPDPNFKDRNRNGWVLRPKQRLQDSDEDNAVLQREFKRGIMGGYRTSPKHPLITVVDEAFLVHHDLKLQRVCEAPLTRGLPDNMMWTLMQRGRFISYHCYSAPEHIFIYKDDDKTNQQRYSEIGGVDPRLIMEILPNLRTEELKGGNTISECLYIRRSGPRLAIVGIT